MFTISENAGRQIQKLLVKQGLAASGGLRVGVKAGGCSGLSYTFGWEDSPKETDEVVEGPQHSRVFIDKRSLKFIEGTVLDYDTNLISKGFVLENPLAKSTCGCGHSFAV